ncbi:MAG: rhomboid family intramembrane serine protease [Candidatus Marinimicrobia bacterium]|jgi:membrane associated rhomboid family serine protease|nr:rhomboid family intramembrane serine protease [Candidatus Neomarinimicrobiota bacterium]MBT4662804.1 rhomboid family intramembrane serine protease [Candidatus Neomarinimicrobiota bacterium]MBT6982110.1 rhomboid family intramembrane serine protease [Candidatus Neomarinimicrobiota bacterium]MBT7118392.1 rhomboid family intramembrane serine protease [Candidatus Neomarinimicrobiota bacterium]MBT7373228.1 rhomboid family intramembrane serine protease [Candidatus Neomarinimicrobiota bacterium]
MRFQFQSDPGQFSYKPALFTDAIKILVSVNFGIFLLQTIARTEGMFFPLFGLVPKLVWSEFMLWQPFTYLFFHGSIWHVLINMFVLWMFGSELERLWGKKHFLKFYFVTGVGAGLVTMIIGLNSMTPIVGASGAVYGVLLAYGLTYPNRTVYLYGIIPIKSLWFVIGIGVIAFMSSFDNVSQISHLTHLSGMVIGYLMLKRPVRFNDLWFTIRKRTLEYKIKHEEKKVSQHQEIEREIDSILDKINREGFDSLTSEEHDRLYKGSQSLSRTKKKD